MKNKAVLFDLGNTLVSYYKASDFIPILQDCTNKLCEYLLTYGKEFDNLDIFHEAQSFNVEREDLSIYPLAERLQTLFKLDDEFMQQHEKRLSELFLNPIFNTAKLDSQAIPLLIELRQRGYATALISNTPWGSPSELWRQELEKHGLLQHLNEVVFCVDAGKRKPHNTIFEFTLKKLGIAASDSIFIGDDPKWDVHGAEQAGIKPILIDPNGKSNATTRTTITELSQLLQCL